MAHLPADVLTAVLRQALPAPDADGFLRAQDVARVCASFGGTCRAWREALLKHLSAPSQGGHKVGDARVGLVARVVNSGCEW